MSILIVIFCFLLLCGWRVKTKFGLLLIILLFCVVVGLRHESVGKDTLSYISIYESIGSVGYWGYPEPLFGYVNLLFYRMGFSFPMFQLVLSGIIFGLIGNVVMRYSPNYGYSMFVLYGCYFVFYTMNITRQMLAVSILTYGYHLLYNRKNIKFIICVLLATFFHYSSIIALGVLLFRKMKLSTTAVMLSVLGTLVLGIGISDAMLMRLAGSYARYLESDSAGFRSGIRIVQAILLAGWWSLLFLYVFFTSRKRQHNDLWFRIYYISVLINNLLLNTELGLRCTLYFSIAQTIVFAQQITDNRIKQKLVSPIIISLFITVFFVIFSYNGSAGVFPYLLVKN